MFFRKPATLQRVRIQISTSGYFHSELTHDFSVGQQEEFQRSVIEQFLSAVKVEVSRNMAEGSTMANIHVRIGL